MLLLLLLLLLLLIPFRARSFQDGVNYARNTRQFQPPRVGDNQVLNIITNSVTPMPQPGKVPVDTRPPLLRSLAALRPADA